MTNKVTRTAPRRVWLQVSDDHRDSRDSFPNTISTEVTWCANQIGGCEVEYVRADIADEAIRRIKRKMQP